jgi:hypothetical protein
MKSTSVFLSLVAASSFAFGHFVKCALADSPITRYVIDHEGAGSITDFFIERNGQQATPHKGAPLDIGDCITRRRTAIDSTSALILILDGEEIHVDPALQRYCVRAPARNNAVLRAIANTFAHFAPVFHRAEKTFDAPITTTITRPGPGGSGTPVILLLQGRPQRIAAGRRTLAFSWFGGKPPFRIQLFRQNIAGPVAATTSELWTAAFAGRTYALGSYRVSIQDATTRSGSGAFAVVASEHIPPLSGDAATAIRSRETPRDLAAALDAARLIANPTQSWDFEAYQRVIPYRGHSALAKRLVRALELGTAHYDY